MKKSSLIKLVLLAATISSCNERRQHSERNVFMRSDSTASYSKTSHSGGHHGGYYLFRPYGLYSHGYSKAGYYSNAINKNSNIGSNPFKSNIIRGGFGRSSFRVSS